MLDPNPPTVRPIHDVDLERLCARDPQVRKRLSTCLTCGGKGTFRWKDPQTGEPTDWTCACDEQLLLHLFLLNAGIDLRYQKLGWGDLVGTPKPVTKAIRDYVDNINAFAAAGVGMVLYGGRGTGKTLLSTLLLRRLLAAGIDGFTATWQEIIAFYSQGWRDEEAQRWFDRRVRRAGVLVIDDLGKEHGVGRSAEVVEAAFDHILRSRVASCRPTILTTNKTLDEIGQAYSAGALSLLDECSITVEFQGTDFRPQQSTRSVDESRQGLIRPVVID